MFDSEIDFSLISFDLNPPNVDRVTNIQDLPNTNIKPIALNTCLVNADAATQQPQKTSQA